MIYMIKMPGPASSVVERSLRNIFSSQGTALNRERNLCLAEFPTIGRDNQSRNLVSLKFAVATTYYCMKRNVALEIGPTEREALRGRLTQPYTLLRNTTIIYNKPATCDVIITSLTYGGDKDDG